MRLFIPIVSVALAIALAGVVWPLEERNLEEAQEISKLKAELADRGFDFKRQCATEADRFFKLWNNDPNSTSRYESHYNPSRKECFVLILESEESSNVPSENYLELTLFDAVERRQYAYLFKWNQPGQSPICTLMPGDGEAKTCDTHEEFNAFVANYMESTPDLQ
jgi:hypothetical protein